MSVDEMDDVTPVVNSLQLPGDIRDVFTQQVYYKVTHTHTHARARVQTYTHIPTTLTRSHTPTHNIRTDINIYAHTVKYLYAQATEHTHIYRTVSLTIRRSRSYIFHEI